MSTPTPKVDLKRKHTYEEWYQLIQTSQTKYEFVDGYLVDVRAMAGGTLEHADIAVNVLTHLRTQLDGKPCRPRNSDLAVRAKTHARYRYPDISVFCAEPEFDPTDESKLVALNPKLVIEILSDSTESTDRGQKFRDYIAIDSLTEYVLISQHQAMVESFSRVDDTWRIQYWTGLDAVAKLSSIQIDLPLRAVYAGIDLPLED